MKMAVLHKYNAFCIGLLGAMLRKLAIFKDRKVVHVVAFFASPLGGDVEEIGHVQKEELL